MQAALSDPRRYPTGDLGNRLIHYAQSTLDAHSDNDRTMWAALLEGAINDLMAQNDTLPVSVALAMAPSQPHYKVLWQALRSVIEIPQGRHAILFALPVVLVAGSRQRATLPSCLYDSDKLNALMREHGLFTAGAEVCLSNKLFHPNQVLEITPLHLYQYTRQLVKAEADPPLALEPSAVICQAEGVFLRYLLGVAIQQESAPSPVTLAQPVGTWGIPLMAFLGEQLKTEGVTLFPIPRAPMPLMQAIVSGQLARLEVALQVFASTSIRKLRAIGKTPVAMIAAHEGEELRFSLSAPADGPSDEAFIWPLSPLDSVPLIESNFRHWMAEYQVNEVQVVAGIQPIRRDRAVRVSSYE